MPTSSSVLNSVCVAEAETAWDAWLAGLLRNALAAAPMDMAGLWGVSVRFGLNGIMAGRRDPVALSSVLELISEPTGPGAGIRDPHATEYVMQSLPEQVCTIASISVSNVRAAEFSKAPCCCISSLVMSPH